MSIISERQKRARHEVVQQAIYEAAVDIISRSDFEGLRMQEVASAVGIATGTLYNYFKNKAALYVEQTKMCLNKAADRRFYDTINTHFVIKYQD